MSSLTWCNDPAGLQCYYSTLKVKRTSQGANRVLEETEWIRDWRKLLKVATSALEMTSSGCKTCQAMCARTGKISKLWPSELYRMLTYWAMLRLTKGSACQLLQKLSLHPRSNHQSIKSRSKTKLQSTLHGKSPRDFKSLTRKRLLSSRVNNSLERAMQLLLKSRNS